MARKPGGDRRSVAKKMLTIERRSRALELRKQNWSYVRIAEELGYKGKQGAHRAVDLAMADERAKCSELAAEVRQLELARCDADELKLREVAEKNFVRAKAGDADSGKIFLGAFARIAQIRERRARYLALDAPEKHEVTGKDGTPLLDVRSMTDEQLAALAAGHAFAGDVGGRGAGASTKTSNGVATGLHSTSHASVGATDAPDAPGGGHRES